MHWYMDQRRGEALTSDSSGRLSGGGRISGKFLGKGEEERNWLEEGHGRGSVELAAGI